MFNMAAGLKYTYAIVKFTVTYYFPIAAHLGLVFNNEAYIRI
jgi:hypothetical protein